MDFQEFLLLYKSLIRSHSEYAQTVWRPFRSKLIEAIEKVQKRCYSDSKILPVLSQLSHTRRLQKLDLPKLVCRIARGDMIEVFKIVHSYYDPKGVPFLQPSSCCNTRGHNKNLFKLRSHLDLQKHCFTVRVVSKL